jgi:hypothetical protein
MLRPTVGLKQARLDAELGRRYSPVQPHCIANLCDGMLLFALHVGLPISLGKARDITGEYDLDITDDPWMRKPASCNILRTREVGHEPLLNSSPDYVV